MPKKQESTGGVTWGQMEKKGKTCNLILTGMLNRGGQKGRVDQKREILNWLVLSL